MFYNVFFYKTIFSEKKLQLNKKIKISVSNKDLKAESAKKQIFEIIKESNIKLDIGNNTDSTVNKNI